MTQLELATSNSGSCRTT